MSNRASHDNPSSSLSRELIAAKALELADREGIENISMRKLASELGKTAMALYRYFDSIEDIRVSVVALAFTEVDSNAIPGERWDDTIRRTTSSIRDMYLRHARANLAFVHMSGNSPAFAAHIERIYTLHTAQGIPPQILDKAWRLIDAFLTGFLFNECIELQSARERLSGNESQWHNAVTGAYSDEAFRNGIDIILEGIAALAAPDSADWHTPM